MKSNVKILRMNPNIFITWIFIISISMIFVSLISAYIVKKGEPGGLIINLPNMFIYSTIVVVLSSLFKQLAYFSAKKDDLNKLNIYLLSSILLGLSFLVLQYFSWGELVNSGIYLVGHPDGSFIYVITGVHAFHLITGLVFIAIVLFKSLKLDVHSKNLNLIEMSTTYWHFLTGLWLYLYLTLYLYN